MDVEIEDNAILMRLKITSATCSAFAIAATAYRLYVRRRKLWADDLWALVAAVALIVQVVAFFFHIAPPNDLSYTVRLAVYYLTATTFYLVVWGSRLSILFSIVRIDPSPTRRRYLRCAAVILIGCAVALLTQLFWICESRHAWKHLPNPQCNLPQQVAILQFVTDVIADAMLLFAPWPLFRSLVDKSLAHKLTIIFSICLATTIVSLVHASFVLTDDDIKMPFSGIVECCLSLVVANIPVIITTTIDIVGQPDTAEFSTVFWLGTTGTGTAQLQTLAECHSHGRLSDTDSLEDMSSESWKSSTKAILASVESFPPV
ncbi:hypothetical protein C8R45DRAFT_990848 [Mycena sanguinolenta]|nr:hypothetical protein C8R45DRAFT_990848 [Mycena sanguinolenta]